MKITHEKAYALLILLTFLVAFIAEKFHGIYAFVFLILGLSSLKFLTVAFQFMEIKKAHAFWKFFIVFYVAVYTLIVGLIV
jgi:hypothetical protein